MQYIQLLVRSDREKAIPVLEGFRDKYPNLAPYVLRELGRAGHPLELPNAISIYQTSTDTGGMLQAEVSALKDLAEPNDIASLKCRNGLPQWMNESLVSVIRFKSRVSSVSLCRSVLLRICPRQDRSQPSHLCCMVRADQRSPRSSVSERNLPNHRAEG